MAERIQVELVDDIDGTAAQHTVTFALDGVTYEIDLSEQHAQQLRSVFARYIERSRPNERASSGATRQQERQQERDEQETRQANRQLTEQIRGAAQRTREHLNKKAPQAETPDSSERAEGADRDFASAEAQESEQSRNPQQDSQAQQEVSDQDESRVPAVSLPQFSSAVD